MELKAWHFVIAMILFTGLTCLLGNRDMKKRPSGKTAGYMTELDEASLTDSLSTGLCFVLFYLEDSQLCDKMADNLNRLAKSHRHETGFFRLNLNNYPQYKQTYKISGVPTILMLEDNREISRIMGVVSEHNLKIIYAKATR